MVTIKKKRVVRQVDAVDAREKGKKVDRLILYLFDILWWKLSLIKKGDARLM